MGSRSLASRIFGLAGRIPFGLQAPFCYAVAMFWAKSLSMLLVPLLTRMLPPAAFGRLELLSSAAEIGGLIAGAGLVEMLYRFAGTKQNGRRTGAQVAGLSLVIAAICIVLVITFSPMIARSIPLPTPRGDVILLGISVSLEATIGVPLTWLRMERRAGAFTVLSMLRISIQIGLMATLVACGFGVTGVLWAGAATSVLFAILMTLRQWNETGIAFHFAESFRLLAYGIPLIGSGIFSFILGTADRWLLAGQVSAETLGQYALAAKVALIVALLAQPFDFWWQPQRLSLIHTPEGRLRSSRVVGAGAATTLCTGAASAFVSPWLVAWLAPPSYAPAGIMAPFLVLAIVLQVLSSMANAGCYSRRTGAMPMVVMGAAATVALGLYILLIPRFGVAGAIVATIGGQAVRLALFSRLSQRIVPLDWPLRRLAVMAVTAITAGAAPLLLGTDTPGIILGVSALAVTFLLAWPAIRRVYPPVPLRRVREPVNV